MTLIPSEPISELNKFESTHVTGGDINCESNYDTFIKESPYIAGDICKLIPAKEIPWIKPELLEEGRQFVRQNLVSIGFANTLALMYGFSVKPESGVLLRTGRFTKTNDSFLRYISTVCRVHSWYFDDILSVDSPAYKNCQLVRNMHSKYAKSTNPQASSNELETPLDANELCEAMRADLDFVDISDAPQHLLTWDPTVQISQFDMALTQFGFFGIIFMFPWSIGISDHRGFDGFMHFWAVIGRLLGLEDRFNLALNPDSKLLHKIFICVIIASLKASDSVVISLQNALMSGLGKRLPFVSHKAVIYFSLRNIQENYEGKNLYKLMSWYDKVCCGFMWMVSRFTYHCGPFRKFVNTAATILFKLARSRYIKSAID